MAVPIIPIIQGAIGLGQTIFGGNRAAKAERKLEGMVNDYKPNASILDYYNKALSRYNANPYTSNLYNNQMQSVNRNLTTGINSLQDRRSAIGGINALTQSANDASLRAAATAEGQQAQALSQLGGATQMKAQEQFKPFEMKYNLLSAKAGGGNQIMNAGLSNIFGGLNTAADLKMIDKMYKDK
jgi:hypothetical protein